MKDPFAQGTGVTAGHSAIDDAVNDFRSAINDYIEDETELRRALCWLLNPVATTRLRVPPAMTGLQYQVDVR